MSRGKWLLVVVGAAVFLLAVGVLGGGVYRTVNLGDGEAYVVNRFTGKAFPVIPQERKAKLDPAAEAIDLVKREGASRFFSDAGAAGLRPSARIPISVIASLNEETVEQYLGEMARNAKGRVRTIGWKADRQPDGLFVVSFRAERPGRAHTKGLGWEVDVQNRIVRFINDDPELARHYGFENGKVSTE
jgi:hypothetical protein